ncbi:hypothetical protein GGI12_004935, partial [Dipsacomyces acuminosporus]
MNPYDSNSAATSGAASANGARFALDPAFVSSYEQRQPPFGFNGLGEIVYRRTYSRLKPSGTREKWHETIERVVNGTFNIQKEWMRANGLPWNEQDRQQKAQAMYGKIFSMKFLPPGRGLWAMGSPLTEQKKLYAALNNCAFVSTSTMWDGSPSRPFTFLMDAAMLGVGVGFDTKGAHMATQLDVCVQNPSVCEKKEFAIPDTREGWVESVALLLDAYLNTRSRTAEIAFGERDDMEYIDLKNYEKNPRRAEFGWTSNNSIFANVGMDYKDICQRIIKNGEPGFQWLENARTFGRFVDPPTDRDRRVEGTNPCNEQSLESYELCCLVETFPSNHSSLSEYLETLELAFLYAKTVTLVHTHWPETNQVMLRNRRIGTSVSGIAQFITSRGVDELQTWLDTGYKYLKDVDCRLSEQFAVPTSVKISTVKPSGTVSLLAGATPGMHYPESRFCIRRIRVSKLSDLLPTLKQMGYYMEDDLVDRSSMVVEIPIDHGEGIRGLKDVSMWEQLALAAFLQRYWSDNQVSCTVTFDPQAEGRQLSLALNYYQYQLKGICFLPRTEQGAFPQMPYEAIDESRYSQM